VLIVDDGVAIREVTRSVLEGEGFEVWEAEQGAEGVRESAGHQARFGLTGFADTLDEQI